MQAVASKSKMATKLTGSSFALLVFFLLLNRFVDAFVAPLGVLRPSAEIISAARILARAKTVPPPFLREGYNERCRSGYSTLRCNNEENGASSDCVPSERHPHTSTLCSSSGPITHDDLSDENIVKIVRMECSDADANVLVWRCLGYIYDEEIQSWDATAVFPKWCVIASQVYHKIQSLCFLLYLYRKEKYPQPVDLIGVTRIYDPAVDKPVRTASMSLMRGIPRDFKGGLRNLEKTVGFKGFKLSELTPNITRRGQVWC